MSAIITGIINKITGEIIESSSDKADKTKFAVKVRDELGCKHGRGNFMQFEFGGLCHMAYYQRQTINAEAFLPLQILQVKYRIQEAENNINRKQSEIDFIETSYETIANQDNLTDRTRDYLLELIDADLAEAYNIRDDQHIKHITLQQLTTRLSNLEAKQQGQ